MTSTDTKYNDIIELMLAVLICTFFVFLSKSSFGFQEIPSKTITELLAEADNIRTTNRPKFNQIIEQVGQLETDLTQEQLIKLTYLKGFQRSISGDIKEATTLLDKVIEQNIYLDLKYRAMTTKMNIYSFSENYQEGFFLLKKLQPLLPEIKEPKSLQQALFVISMFYNRLSQWSLSNQYVNKLLESSPTPRYACLASMLQMEANYKLKLLTWENINNNLVSTCESVNELIASNIIYSFMAKFYLDNREADLALNLLIEHLPSALSTEYYMLIAEFNSLISKAYFDKKEYFTSLNYAQKVLSSAKPSHKSDSIIRANEVFYLVHKHLGNFEESLKYHEQFAHHTKLVVDDQNRRNVSYQIAQKDAKEKGLQIQMLDEKNKVLNLEKQLIENENNQKQLLNLLFAIVIIVLAVWTYRSKRMQKQLKKIANHDELTGVFNRRCFNELAKSAISYYTTTNQQLSLILFDLDNFKQINDNYGHHIGDWVLKTALKTCSSLSRKNDIIGRFGGEEFTILLPGCNQNKAKELANRYRRAINNISTSETGIDFKISASFGVYSSNEKSKLEDTNLETIIQLADKAMYFSKENGRNKVSVYGVDVN